jgi:transcriptional regulator of met regulon
MAVIDREKWPHVYVGPKTEWGLSHNDVCKIIGKRSNDVIEILTQKNGRKWIVPRATVKTYSKLAKAGAI